MILRLCAALQHAQGATGVEGSFSHDLQQHGFTYMMRTGAGYKNTSGAEQAECAKVDVFISADGAIDLLAGPGESRWIEDHHIEASARRGITGENFERVGLAKSYVA